MKSTVATVSQDDTIRVWDLNIEQPRFILNGHVNVGTEVVFSSDGATLASGGDWPENTIQLWNPDTGALRDTLEGHTDSISALAFSADGTTLASGSRDKTIRLWNTHTAELKTMFEGQRREVQSLAFAPDGKTLASGSGWEDTIIRLWDTDIAQQIGRLETYTRWVYALAFSPDSQDPAKMFLASGSGEGTIQVWHLDSERTSTNRPQMTLTAHTDGVLALAFSPVAVGLPNPYKYHWVLASGSRDDTLRLWKLTVGEPTPRSLILQGHDG